MFANAFRSLTKSTTAMARIAQYRLPSPYFLVVVLLPPMPRIAQPALQRLTPIVSLAASRILTLIQFPRRSVACRIHFLGKYWFSDSYLS